MVKSPTIGLDTKTYWLTDRQSQSDSDSDSEKRVSVPAENGRLTSPELKLALRGFNSDNKE
jgi:hypothetical protein